MPRERNLRKHGPADVARRAAAVLVLSAALGAGAAAAQAPAGERPAATYWVYVGAESADLLHRVRFGPDGAEVEKTIPAGVLPTETEGPHGLRVDAAGKYLHVTTGHGLPFGQYWKYALGPDTLVGAPVALGDFPATLDVTPDGLYAFVVNFNLHGEHVPSTISVVYTPENTEVERITTCTMPHGARMNPAGTRLYSACMMDDQLVELDTNLFQVARRFSVSVGDEGPIEEMHDNAMHAQHMADPAHAMQHAMEHGEMAAPTCSPTWAEPSPDGRWVYVACNKANTILQIDAEDWRLERTLETGTAPYNLAATPDGRRLVATLKKQAAVQVFDLSTGESLATMPSTTTVTHGVVVSPDSRYAFVSVEGVGAEPGKVDIYDLESFERVASVEVGQQAGGIAFWKMEAR